MSWLRAPLWSDARPVVLGRGESVDLPTLKALAERSVPGMGLYDTIVGDRSVRTIAAIVRAVENQRTACLLPPPTPKPPSNVFRTDGAAPDLDDAFDPFLPPLQEEPRTTDIVLPPAAFILRSSGSEGRPKLLVLPFECFEAAASMSAEHLGWEPEDRWLLNLPLHHVAGLNIVARCLLAGRTIVLDNEPQFDASDIVDVIEEHRVTLMSLVPTMLHRLLADGPQQAPSCVRAVLLGGAPASDDLVHRAIDRGWPILRTYGMSETCGQLATVQPAQLSKGAEVGCGPLLPGVQARIEDGCIEVQTPALFAGTVGRTHETPWFRTKDRGFFDAAGNLHIEGRVDDMLISGGENISPRMVEDALEAIEEIDESFLFGIPDAEWGTRICLAYCGAPSLAEDVVRKAVKDALPGIKCPLLLLPVEALPRTETGKVRRAELREWAQRSQRAK